MPIETYVQVAPDSTGKKVEMEQGTQADGSTVYRQKAVLVGDPADAILAMRDELKIQTAVLRGILFALTNGDVTEEMFLDK